TNELTWRRCNTGLWAVCSRELAISTSGRRSVAATSPQNAKLLLQVCDCCSICLLRFGDGDETVNPAGCCFISFASGVCLLRQQCSKPFTLRHDAAGFCRDET